MTDPALVAKRLAVIEGCVSDLRRLARPELLGADVREERFVQHTLQIAIQAALDVASHIVSDERLGEPETNRQVFDLLVRRQHPDPRLSGGRSPDRAGDPRAPAGRSARVRGGCSRADLSSNA